MCEYDSRLRGEVNKTSASIQLKAITLQYSWVDRFLAMSIACAVTRNYDSEGDLDER